ncbi:MAG: flavodoxin family protein [bacterium]
MKIVAILGSPRKSGNSARVAERFCETAKNLGAEIQTFMLNQLMYRGCQACYACKTKSDTCIVVDDLTLVLEAVRKADVVVLATPTYYGDISGQLKLFIDRTFSYLTPEFRTSSNKCRLAPGKTMVFIQTQGNSDSKVFAEVFPRYTSILQYYQFKPTYLIRGCGLMTPKDLEAQPEILKQAEEIARKILEP